MGKPPQVSELCLEATLDNLLHSPTLVRTQWTALLDEYAVACSAIVSIIVSLVALSALDELLVNGVTHATGHLNNDGLVVLITGNQPDELLLICSV
jgi:hypothetical protein